MIMLSHSDARSYCIGVAQLIPVFLIALFVLDNGRVNRAAKKINKDSSATEMEGRKLLSFQKKHRRELEQSLGQIDAQISSIDRIDPSLASEEALAAREITLQELTEARARVANASDELTASGKRLTGLLDRAPKLRQELDAAARKLVSGYTILVMAGIFLGVAGEVMALWGAVGLMSSLFAIAWITNIAIIVIGLLSVFTLDRFLDEYRARLAKFIQTAWFTFILAVAQFTFSSILLHVKVIH